MAENVLNLSELDARLDEVRGIGVAQAVGRNALLQTAGFDHRPQRFLNTAAIERCPGGARAWQSAVPIGKQQNGIAVALPETAQELVSSEHRRASCGSGTACQVIDFGSARRTIPISTALAAVQFNKVYLPRMHQR
jgi:hypothetical protein